VDGGAGWLLLKKVEWRGSSASLREVIFIHSVSKSLLSLMPVEIKNLEEKSSLIVSLFHLPVKF